VSEYVGFDLLPSAVADVDALQGILLDPQRGEFLAENIKSLKNPDKRVMEDAIYDLFYDREKDDLLLFYFSGHGIVDHDNRKELYLATGITRKQANGFLYHPSAIAAAYLRQRIESSNSQRQVIILDCCYSGAIAYGMSIKDDGTVKVEDYLGGKGRAILTSSTAREVSMAGNINADGSIGLSIYTHYLVEGLTTGAADLDKDGTISVDELHEYASKKVKVAAPAMNPELYRVSDGSKILVAKSPTDPKLEYENYLLNRIALGGNFSNIQRRTLTHKQQNLGISPEDASTIEERVLQPYREYHKKLVEYEHELKVAVQEGYPLVQLLAELKEYQQELKLRDEDITDIHRRLLPQASLSQPNPAPAAIPTAPSAPISKPSVIETPLPTQTTIPLSTFSFETAQVKLVSRKIEITKIPGSAQHFIEELGNGVKLEMVYVPGGQFMMGSPKEEESSFDDERPQHSVNVPSFLMSKYPVTQAQYETIIGSNPAHFKGSQRPVERVSWQDAQAFCQKLAKQTNNKPYRLPSEAEWEYACRAGTKTPFYFGATISPDVVNYDGNYPYGQAPKGVYRGSTTDVGIFPANSFGLYDLHGNVWEWCQDTWHENYQGAPTDGTPWLNNNSQVLRGGSWDDNARGCRSAYREWYTLVNRIDIIGFRLALPPSPGSP
jgi:formylglycine-generating enzyme required for sulfatase activity